MRKIKKYRTNNKMYICEAPKSSFQLTQRANAVFQAFRRRIFLTPREERTFVLEALCKCVGE